jgi:hypothetical protein
LKKKTWHIYLKVCKIHYVTRGMYYEITRV